MFALRPFCAPIWCSKLPARDEIGQEPVNVYLQHLCRFQFFNRDTIQSGLHVLVCVFVCVVGSMGDGCEAQPFTASLSHSG